MADKRAEQTIVEELRNARPDWGMLLEEGGELRVADDGGLWSVSRSGEVAREVEALMSVGMSATEAIGAATWEAREWLGHEGLVEGASADVVVYADDPRQDVRVLADPQHVLLRGARHGG